MLRQHFEEQGQVPRLSLREWDCRGSHPLQSFAAEAAQTLPDPPTKPQMYRALMRLPNRRNISCSSGALFGRQRRYVSSQQVQFNHEA